MGRSDSRSDRRVLNDMVELSHDSADNRTSLVIVALPSENDPVQKISSEKAAHMTLLYLGEPNFDQSRIDLISGFVEHAASTLSPFMLDVERRGELGPDKADVLFFVKRYAKRIATFRDQLLQNDLISEAYNSVEQYPEWTPHLTLGYPTTPAKKSPNEDSGIWYVNFDRIALWTGDSTGPTFQLLPKDNDLEVAMSQSERGRAFVEGELGLNHYGVKGMHWGVRRSQKSDPHPPSEDHVRKVQLKDQIKGSGVKSLSNKELRDFLERVDLEQRYSKIPKQKSASSEATKMIKDILINVGKQEATKIIAKQVGKTVLKVGL
jgi:2'-5' RNA ligase